MATYFDEGVRRLKLAWRVEAQYGKIRRDFWTTEMIARLLVWVWDSQRLTCREAIRLSAKAMERDLNFSERVKLTFHYLLCSYCRNYARQLQLVRKWLRRMGPGDASGARMRMSSLAALRIKKRLESESSD